MASPTLKNREKTVATIKEPTKFKVIIHNDDITPMEFVMDILMGIFKHSSEISMELTLKIHNEQSAVVGIYTYEIAEQKAIDATLLARNNGYPLIIKLEAI